MSEQIKKGTVLSALMWAINEFKSTGIESFRLDAELLLSEVLSLSRVQLYINYDRPMNMDEKEKFFAFVRRRKKREPVAYILNRKEFMSQTFYVDRNVLIPRPETECMVEWILKEVRLSEDSKVIDIGTGSGCIAISILKNSPLSTIFASDISEKALMVARRNFETLCSEKRFSLIQASLLEGVDESNFDLIVSNPPYLRRWVLKNLMPEISEFEPMLALDGGESGDEIIYRLIEEAYFHIKEGGILVFEHGDDFVINKDIIHRRYEILFSGKDYSNRNRFLALRRV
ncbi:MAG: peptide chain release factor N(5)-glutamine methyltransferase [Myxococcota bacterium]